MIGTTAGERATNSVQRAYLTEVVLQHAASTQHVNWILQRGNHVWGRSEQGNRRATHRCWILSSRSCASMVACSPKSASFATHSPGRPALKFVGFRT